MSVQLELAAVSKRFGSHIVLNELWLRVHAGEIVGLVGRNGAGKTTALRIAAGLIGADSGVVRIGGLHLAATDPQPPRYFGGETTMPPGVRVRAWSALFGVPSDDGRRLSALSRGTRQQVGLQTVLNPGPTGVVLLDEPWEGLDPPAAAWLSAKLRECRAAGAATLVSSHRLHELTDVCDRFVALEGGRCHAVNDAFGNFDQRRRSW